jgi:hypothetical protein
MRNNCSPLRTTYDQKQWGCHSAPQGTTEHLSMAWSWCLHTPPCSGVRHRVLCSCDRRHLWVSSETTRLMPYSSMQQPLSLWRTIRYSCSYVWQNTLFPVTMINLLYSIHDYFVIHMNFCFSIEEVGNLNKVQAICYLQQDRGYIKEWSAAIGVPGCSSYYERYLSF